MMLNEHPTPQDNENNSIDLNEAISVQPKKKFKLARPGRLVNKVQLLLHTQEAQMAFIGQGKERMGLLPFAQHMGEMWSAAEKDDPYADVYLLKIYDAMMQLRNAWAVRRHDYLQQLNQTQVEGSFFVKPFLSEKPLIKTLWFATPYGYLGAQLIADFDELMRILFTAQRIGVRLEQSSEAMREEGLQKISALFKLAFKWQHLEITRADVNANNALAQHAKKILGKLPQSVLTQQLRAPFAPMIQLSQSAKIAGSVDNSLG